MSYLELENIVFRKDDFELKCSLRLEKGSIGVLLGPSGSGKTSLLRCISGLERPESGSITLTGKRIDALPIENRNIGFVFQDLALFDHMNARKNIEFGMKLQNLGYSERRRRTEDLAATLRITSLLERMPGSMSGGERQRLAMARSLAIMPDLILLDEPFSALDAPLRKEMRDFLRVTLKASSMTALHVTHDVEEALDLGDVIFLMKDGRLLGSGPPEDLFSNPPNAWSVSFLRLGISMAVKDIRSAGDALAASAQAATMLCPGNASPGMMTDSRVASRSLCIFLPSSEARLSPGQKVTGDEGCAENRLAMIVEKVAFNGKGRRITARSILAPDASAEFDVEMDAAFSVGDSITAEYPMASCRLIPLDT